MLHEVRTVSGEITRVHADRQMREAGCVMSTHHCHPYFELGYIEITRVFDTYHISCYFTITSAKRDFHRASGNDLTRQFIRYQIIKPFVKRTGRNIHDYRSYFSKIVLSQSPYLFSVVR